MTDFLISRRNLEYFLAVGTLTVLAEAHSNATKRLCAFSTLVVQILHNARCVKYSLYCFHDVCPIYDFVG